MVISISGNAEQAERIHQFKFNAELRNKQIG